MPVLISDDNSLLDIALIHQYLSEHSAWAKGVSFETVETSIEHSLCFGAYLKKSQIGFARVITDYATFANLVDVFVLPEHQGQGAGKALMQAVIQHRRLSNLRRITLATADAHGLYKKFGFTRLHKPHTFMEIYRPNIYSREI